MLSSNLKVLHVIGHNGFRAGEESDLTDRLPS